MFFLIVIYEQKILYVSSMYPLCILSQFIEWENATAVIVRESDVGKGLMTCKALSSQICILGKWPHKIWRNDYKFIDNVGIFAALRSRMISFSQVILLLFSVFIPFTIESW